VNGFEIVVFGQGSTEILDLDTLTWRAGPVNNELKNQGVSLPDGKSFLAISGNSQATGLSPKIMRLDPESYTWVTLSSTLSSGHRHFAAMGATAASVPLCA